MQIARMIGALCMMSKIAVNSEQCITYEIETANGISKATVRMQMMISQWRMLDFNIDPPSAKASH
jgi:hypothetical protein